MPGTGAAIGGLSPDGADTQSSWERRAPGLAAVLEPLKSDGRHAVLDLGPALGQHLRLFGPYARRIRFADLLGGRVGVMSAEELSITLPADDDQPPDVVLAWDVLDPLTDLERVGLVGRLTEVTAPGARLYLVVGEPGAREARPLHSIAVAPDRVSHAFRPGPTVEIDPPVPARVERLLGSFAVARAFMLRNGFREYVAVRR